MNKDNLILKPKRGKGDDGYKVFSIRVPEETLDKLDNISSKTNHSRNELINILLTFAMDRCIVEDDTKIKDKN